MKGGGMRLSSSSIHVGLRVLVVVLLIGGVVAGDSWVTVTPEGTPALKDPTAAIAPILAATGFDETGGSVSIEAAGFALVARKTKGGEFVEVTWPDAPVAGEVGTAGLPVVRRLFVAPPDVAVTISMSTGDVVVVDLQALDLPRQVMPVQPPIPKVPGAREHAEFIFDERAYAVNADLLVERAVIEELGIIRGQRLFLLEVRPVDYNPVAQTLTFWPKTEVRVGFAGEPGPASTLTPLPGLGRIVLNPAHAAGGTRGSGNYLIVTGTNFETDIAAFAAFKATQGFTVSTHAVAPGTSNSTIKSYIQGLWGTGDAPEYILLVGDTQVIPHWVGQGDGSPDTDLPYGCMDGSSDWYPDIAIGRFPADNSAELQTLVNKTLYYENGPLEDPGYKKRAVFMASVDNYNISEGTHNYVIDNYMDPNGYEVDKLYQVTHGATTQDVINSYNDGRFYGIYSGHGGSTSWADGPPLSAGQVEALTNENKYAFICSFACSTGDYAAYDECFMETWVLAANAGLASWGSSVSSYWTEDDILEKRLFDAIFDNTDDVKTEAGPIYNEARVRYLEHFGSDSTTRRYFEMYNLMGDPALPLPSACSDAGEISLDRAKYPCEGTASIEVADCGLNLNDNEIDTVVVTIESDSELGGESVTLSETDSASAQFQGSIDLSATDAAGVLLVGEGDTITVTYLDADDGQGGTNVTVTATATVDCTPPNISNVQATNIEPRSATVVFSADEAVQGTVHYGLACEALSGTAVGSGYSTTPMVNLTSLEDSTAYFYSVEAADEAGNTAGDDNGEECYTFTTPDVPDYFTELFESDNDLDNLSLAFIPDGSNDFYFGCVEPIEELPTDPSGGTSLSFSPSDDDGSATVNLSGGAMVSIYGQDYDTFYPGSNGYITFVHGESGFSESLESHLEGIPRISALYDDLNANYGTVSWKQLDDRAVVTWENIPEYSNTGSNTFQIEMFFDGTIVISYLSISASDGLAGLSEGQGLDPDFFETDLSAMGNCGPRPPTAENMEVNTPVEIPVTIAFEAADDGLPDPPAALTYIVMSLPEHGPLTDLGAGLIDSVPYALVGGGNQVEYAPDSWFAGMDGFQFKVNDGGITPDGGDSNVATVSIAVGGLSPTYVFPLDSNPGWSCEQQWAFGKPTGNGSYGGDPLVGYTGYYVYGYNLNGDYGNNLSAAYLTTGAFNCSSLTGTELRFRRWLGVDSSSSDHASVEVSNNGVIWTTVWNHSGGAISESSWSLQIYDLSAMADGQSQVYVRWGMGPTNSSTTYPGWNLDDVEIWGIQPLTDCNGNDVPDNVDIAEGTSLDCNSNLYPDECDVVEGTSPDCNSNGIPDECDAAEGTSSDVNGNGVPDECEPPPAMACAPPDGISKNRYVSFEPANGAFTVAYQVELTDSAYFPDSRGVLGWVAEPDENAVARITAVPYFSATWPAVLHLGDCGVVPVAMYELRSTVDGTMFSDPLAVSTIAQPTPKMWGDVVGEFDGSAWTGPNGESNMDDVMAAVQRFRHIAGAPPLIWVDVDAEVPNGVSNFTDILRIVQGFKGEDYPFSAPMDCP